MVAIDIVTLMKRRDTPQGPEPIFQRWRSHVAVMEATVMTLVPAMHGQCYAYEKARYTVNRIFCGHRRQRAAGAMISSGMIFSQSMV